MDAEPTPQASLVAGADLVTFSADKLLGGPQAGIVAGRRKFVDMLRANPLTRALRVDKLILAALEATLRAYTGGDAPRRIPVLTALAAPVSWLDGEAQDLAAAIRRQLGDRLTVEVVDGASPAGGGSLPGVELPARLVSVMSPVIPAGELEERLRHNQPPVLSRIRQNNVLFDPRTLLPGDDEEIVRALARVASEGARA